MILCFLIAVLGTSLARAGQIIAWSFSPDYLNDKLVKDYELVFQLENGLPPTYFLRLDWPYKIDVTRLPSYILYETNTQPCFSDFQLLNSQQILSQNDAAAVGSYLIKFPIYLAPSKVYKLKIIAETPTLTSSSINTVLKISAYTISQAARANAIIVDYNYNLVTFVLKDAPISGITSSLTLNTLTDPITTLGAVYPILIDFKSNINYIAKSIIEITVTNTAAFAFVGVCKAIEVTCDPANTACVPIKIPNSNCIVDSASKLKFYLNETYNKDTPIRISASVKNLYLPAVTEFLKLITYLQINPNICLQQDLTTNALTTRRPLIPLGLTKLLLLWGLDTSATNLPSSTLGIFTWKTTNKVIPYNNIRIEFTLDDDIVDVPMRIFWRIGKVTNIVTGSILHNFEAPPSGPGVDCYGYDFNKNNFLNGTVICESVYGFKKNKVYFISAKALYTTTNYATAAAFNTTEFSLVFYTLVNGVANDLAIVNQVKLKPNAVPNSDFIDLTGFHSRKNFGQNFIVTADNTVPFAQASTSIFDVGAKVGVIPSTEKKRLIFYLNSNSLACSVSSTCGTSTSGLTLNLLFGPGIIVEPQDLALGIEYGGPCISATNVEYCKNYNQGTAALNNLIQYTPENLAVQGAAFYSSSFQCKGDMVSCKKILPGANVTFGLKNISFPSEQYHTTSQNVLDIVVSFRSGASTVDFSAYTLENLMLINVYTITNSIPSSIYASFINYYSSSTNRASTSQYMPTLFKLSGTFSADDLPTEMKFASLSVFFDKYIQADIFINNPLNKKIGCSVSINSSANCYFMNSRDANDAFDNWPVQRSVRIDSDFPKDTPFTVYFPVYNILSGVPSSIVMTGASRSNLVSKAFRIFGSAFKIEDFNNSRSLFSDYKITVTPPVAFTGLVNWFNYSSDYNFTLKNLNYGVDPSYVSKLTRNTSLDSIIFKAGHSSDNYFDIVNNGTNKSFTGAGFTIVSQSAKSILQSYKSFTWEAGNKSPCINFEFVIQTYLKPFSLLHCPSDKAVVNETANLTLKSVKVPLKFGIGALNGEFNYSWSNNEGSMISFQRELISPTKALACQVESLTPVLNVQTTSQRLNIQLNISSDIEFYPGFTTFSISISLETDGNTNFTLFNKLCSIYSVKVNYLTCQSASMQANTYTLVIGYPSGYAFIPRDSYTIEFWVGYSGYDLPSLSINTPITASVTYAGYIIESCVNPSSSLSFSEYSLGNTIYLENFSIGSPMRNTISGFSFDFYTLDQAIVQGDYFLFDFSFVSDGLIPDMPPSCTVYEENGLASFDFVQVNTTLWSFYTITSINSIPGSEDKRYTLKCYPFKAVFNQSMVKAMLINSTGIIKLEADPIQLDGSSSLGYLTVTPSNSTEFFLKEKLMNHVNYEATYTFALKLKVKILRGSEIRFGFPPQNSAPNLNDYTRLLCEVEGAMVDCRLMWIGSFGIIFPDEYDIDREVKISIHRVPQPITIKSTDIIWASLYLFNSAMNQNYYARHWTLNETVPTAGPNKYVEVFNVTFNKMYLRDIADMQIDFSSPMLNENCSIILDFPKPFLEILVSKKGLNFAWQLSFTNDSTQILLNKNSVMNMNRLTMKLTDLCPVNVDSKYNLTLKIFGIPTPMVSNCSDYLFELTVRNMTDEKNSVYYLTKSAYYYAIRKLEFVENTKVELEWEVYEFQGSINNMKPLVRAPRELYSIYCVLKPNKPTLNKFQIDLLEKTDFQKISIIPGNLMSKFDNKYTFLMSVLESVKANVFFLNFKLLDSSNVYALIPPLKLTLVDVKCQAKLSTNRITLHQGGISFPIYLDFSACLTRDVITVSAYVNETYPNGIAIHGPSRRSISPIKDIPTDQTSFIVDFSFESNISESTIGLESYINFKVITANAKYIEPIPDLIVSVDLPILDDPTVSTIDYKPDQANLKHNFEVKCGQTSQLYYVAGLTYEVQMLTYASIENEISNPIENVYFRKNTSSSFLIYGFQNDILLPNFISKFTLENLTANSHYMVKAFCINLNRIPSQEISKEFVSFDNGGRIISVTLNFSDVISNETEIKLLCIMNAIFQATEKTPIISDNKTSCIQGKSSRILQAIVNTTTPIKNFMKFYIFPNNQDAKDSVTSFVKNIFADQTSFIQNINSRAASINLALPQIKSVTQRILDLNEHLDTPKLNGNTIEFNVSEKDVNFNISLNYPSFIYLNISNTTTLYSERESLDLPPNMNFTRIYVEDTKTITISNLTNASNYTLFIIPTPDNPEFDRNLAGFYEFNFTTLNQSNNSRDTNLSERIFATTLGLALWAIYLYLS